MKVFLYGMKDKARDRNNYFKCDYVRDLYLEEMTCDMRDEFYSVLCYKVDSPLQKVRLKVLRSLSKELDSRS